MVIKTIDKYITKEILHPMAFGLAFFVSIWLIDLMMELINLVFSKGVPLSIVLLLFIYSLPPTIVISLPMSVLLAILIAFGRLSSDSEITALKAGGYSFSRISFSAIFIGFIVTIITFIFNEKVVPNANDRFTRLFRREVTLKRPLPQIAENRFFDAGTNRKFYVQKYDSETKLMYNVIMYEAQPNNFPRIIEAQKAKLEEGKCTFWKGRVSQLRDSGSDYHHTYFDILEYPIDTHYVNPDDVPEIKNARQMNIVELYNQIKDMESKGANEIAIRNNWIELWTKTSIPFACLIFSMLAAPLATHTSRSGTSIGIGMSVVIIFIYYVLFAAGKAFAKGGYLSPFVGVWFPNIIIGLVGVYLIIRAKA